MAFVVVYDANVLYPNALRDLLVRIAMRATVQAKWTNHILDEAFGNLAKNRPDIAERLPRVRALMNGGGARCTRRGL